MHRTSVRNANGLGMRVCVHSVYYQSINMIDLSAKVLIEKQQRLYYLLFSKKISLLIKFKVRCCCFFVLNALINYVDCLSIRLYSNYLSCTFRLFNFLYKAQPSNHLKLNSKYTNSIPFLLCLFAYIYS